MIAIDCETDLDRSIKWRRRDALTLDRAYAGMQLKHPTVRLGRRTIEPDAIGASSWKVE